MKTQEEVVRRYAVGPINIYRIYQEGYQDRELDDWSSFRREAAKDILCAMVYNTGGNADLERVIELTDALVAKLKQE